MALRNLIKGHCEDSKCVYDTYTKDKIDEYIGDGYSSSSTYAVGDLVIYDNGLYECSTAITTAEEWTAAHWTEKSIADILGAKANTSHTHDDRYYTETESNESLALKKDNSDFTVVTGTVSLTDGNGNTTVSYPEGFTQTNCIPVSVGIAMLNSEIYDYYENQSTHVLGVKLNTDSISFQCFSVTGTGSTSTKPFKVVLMKIS